MDYSEQEILREVLEAMRSIKFGSVQLILQDGKVVQIDKVEKVRFARRAATGPASA
ncbi:MAG: YezD family protein [Chloroflexi bacterium]|nr:YezD family protein [Chloroflexota bacterium]